MNIFKNFLAQSRVEEKLPTDRPKEVKQILDEQIDTSLKEFERSNTGLLLSSFTAGLEVGFSVLLMGTVYTLFHHDMEAAQMKALLALCYPIGFIFVIIGRSELFTEHTALAILPVLDRSVRISELFMLWGIVYIGNLMGGYVFGGLIAKIGPGIGFIDPKAFSHLAEELVHYDWDIIMMRAM